MFLAQECGKIIREVAKSENFKTKDKSGSPVTIADLRVQRTIEDNLRALFPTLNIQGEESKESIEGIEPLIKP